MSFMYTTGTPSYMIDITPYRLSGHFKHLNVLNLLLSMHADSVHIKYTCCRYKSTKFYVARIPCLVPRTTRKRTLFILGDHALNAPLQQHYTCMFAMACVFSRLIPEVYLYGLCSTKDPVRYHLDLSLRNNSLNRALNLLAPLAA